MCVGFWSLEHPDYALILGSNRDEFLARPTEDAHFHSFGAESGDAETKHTILSGRDLQAGGTWFGINRSGRVAFLTNITEPLSRYTLSRGQLVQSFLVPGSLNRTQFIHSLITQAPAQPPDYAGFNMLLFSPSPGLPLSYEGDLVTNAGARGSIISRPLQEREKECCGMSNGVDGHGAQEWPKVQQGQAAFAQLLKDFSAGSSEAELAERLFDILSWQSEVQPSNRSTLRNSIQIIPIRLTPSLSPDARADGPEYYGTRLSTVVLIRRDGQALFIERDIWQLDSKGQVVRADPRTERVFRFQVE